ncbi:MAG TPA: putative Ig domain-containing protein, partial [Roseiflexaceae bacterium]|nr:putative Ig domain-containing protein [Roseiflexaceae bacterium]
MALSGNTIAVVAEGTKAISVYDRAAGDASTWSDVSTLTFNDTLSGGGFEPAIALHDDRLVAGVWGYGDYGHGGAAYVFDRHFGGANQWGLRSRLLPQNEAFYNSYGISVAFTGDVVLVGSATDDDHGYSSGSTFVFRLHPRPLTSDDAAAVDEDSAVAIDVLANDSTPVGTGSLDPASVAVIEGPTHGTTHIEPSNGAITYIPAPDFNGTDRFLYSIANTIGTRQSAVVTVTVHPVNDAPLFTSATPTAGTAWSPYHYNVAARDIDAGDVLTITAPLKPAWLALSASGNGMARLSGTPADVGQYPVRLDVVDRAGASATHAFTITVTPNTPPRFLSAPSTRAQEDRLYTYSITADDPDPGQAATLTAPQIPRWLQLVTVQGTTILSGTPDYTAVGDHLIQLQAIDPGGLTATQTYTLTVDPARPNSPTHLVAAPLSASAIRLTWRDTSSDELGFHVERRAGDAPWAQLAALGSGATSYVDTNLPCGTVYDYRVSAFNQHWDSTPSNVAQASPNELAQRSFSLNDMALPIQPTSSISTTLRVDDPGSIADIDAHITLDHIYDGDLAFTLAAPDGTSVVLSAYN